MPLPTELQWRIFLEAACDDIPTAHTLAYVSRDVCKITQAHRWKTIALYKYSSLFRFMTTLSWIVQCDNLISIPSKMPTKYTKHLFVDMSDDEEPDLLTRLATLPPETLANMVPATDFLTYFPALDILSLGSVELQAFARGLQKISPISLTLVFDGNETLLSSIFSSSSNTTPSSLLHRLTHLHVIGVSPQSELTGLPMPLTILEPLCAGSMSVNGHLSHQLSEEESDASKRIPGVRHLRYDTRKFSFRPTDIFATRLRHFFQNVQLDTYTGDEEESQYVQSFLRQLGVNMFQRLDLCWRNEQGEGAKERTNVEMQRKRLQNSMYTGGWPQELRGAWTDRGIWHNNAQEAFRQELQESITDLYGWNDSPMNAYVDGMFVDRIRHGFSELENTMLTKLQLYLMEALFVHTANAEAAPVMLSHRIRRPSKFLRLGQQQAALYADERLALFYTKAYAERSSLETV